MEDPEVKLVDMDGDGVTDAIRSGSRLEIFFNDPQKGWNNTRRVERRALEDFPNFNFSDDRVKWADMSGDSLQDIMVIHDGNVEYWPNLGYGNWGKRVQMQNSPRFPYGYNPKRILVGDVDGDGLADLVYVDDTKVTLWFHQGPIGDEFGEWEETDFRNEFWPGDPQVLTRPAKMIDFLKNLPRRVKRDALRTLRGTILRTELYARDDSKLRNLPYTVTESLFGVREESLPAASEKDREHIFFSHALAQRTTQWKRGDEPMTQFTFTGDYDAYGQPRSQISIAVPRGRKYLEAIPSGTAPEPYWATHTVTDYTQRDEADRYLVGRVTRTTTYEIPNDGRDGIFSLKSKIENNALGDPRYIIGQTLNFYDGPAFQGLPFGEIGDYGALVRCESLVLTDEILQAAYGNDHPPFQERRD